MLQLWLHLCFQCTITWNGIWLFSCCSSPLYLDWWPINTSSGPYWQSFLHGFRWVHKALKSLGWMQCPELLFCSGRDRFTVHPVWRGAKTWTSADQTAWTDSWTKNNLCHTLHQDHFIFFVQINFLWLVNPQKYWAWDSNSETPTRTSRWLTNIFVIWHNLKAFELSLCDGWECSCQCPTDGMAGSPVPCCCWHCMLPSQINPVCCYVARRLTTRICGRFPFHSSWYLSWYPALQLLIEVFSCQTLPPGHRRRGFGLLSASAQGSGSLNYCPKPNLFFQLQALNWCWHTLRSVAEKRCIGLALTSRTLLSLSLAERGGKWQGSETLAWAQAGIDSRFVNDEHLLLSFVV